MERIHELKNYRESTLYLAVSVADRYLAKLAARGIQAPKIEVLGVVGLLVAAKINEPLLPNFNNMVILLQEKLQKRIKQEDLI